MTKFQIKFLKELEKLSKNYGFVITEGLIEPIDDWVEPSKKFKYKTQENEDDNLIITGIEMYRG